MLRYLRLYLYFLRFSFSKAMEFRVDYWTRVLMDVVYYMTGLGFYKIVFLHTAQLGGWDESQALVFLAAYFVLDALHMTLYANNMWILPFLVNEGALDYYLVRPVSSLFFLSLREFAANSFVNLIMAVGIFIWALGNLSTPIDLGNLVVFILLIFNGVLLYYLLRMFFILPVFWTLSAKGGESLFFAISRFTDRPDGIFYGATRLLLVTLLPFSLMVSFPAQVMFEGANWGIVLHILGVTAGFALALAFLWGRALRAYSSASS
ncbi:ABC-2 family transporter protein [Oligoflexia bacterium]|nr:ABC-2 family transporter protein [Oligoflexia bacterium]